MGGGCQRKSWKLKLTLPIPIASPFSNSKQIPPSLGDRACTQPGGTSRASPRASTLLPLFWENSQLWPFLAVLGAAPLPWVSGQCSSPPTPPQGPWVVANHGPSQTDTCAHWLGQRTGAWKEEGVCGPGTQNGNRKRDRGGSSSTHYNIHEVNAN